MKNLTERLVFRKIAPRPEQYKPWNLALACMLLASGSTAAQPGLHTGFEVQPRTHDSSGPASDVRLILQDPLEFAQPSDQCTTESCQALINLLDGANERIDFAVAGARNQPVILEAVLRAQARGVTVRGLVDADASGESYYSSTRQWISEIGTIRNDVAREKPCTEDFDHVAPCPKPPGFAGMTQCLGYKLGTDRYLIAGHASREAFDVVNKIMHNKFFIVDETYVWTGSANISDTGTGGYNANAVVVLRSSEVAAVYSLEFEQLWNRGGRCENTRDGIEAFRLEGARVSTWFSPQDRTQQYGVSGLIARAQSEIRVAMFFLTSKYLTADLIDAHRRGVSVRVIIDATGAKNGYSKHEILREAGIPVKVEDWGGKMHMKAASVDGLFLVLGSMNWTSAGHSTNDENSLLVESRHLAEQFDAFYERIWNSIAQQWQHPNARPDPESHNSGTACTDGIDNDFDDLADDADPGCSADPPPLPALPPHRIINADEYERVKRRYRLFRPTRCDPDRSAWYRCWRN